MTGGLGGGEPMGGDEALVLLASGGAAAVVAGRWITSLVRARGGASIRIALSIAWLACAAGLLVILRYGAARQVVADIRLQALFELLGIVVIGGVAGCGSFLGISARHDALGSRNPAAAAAVVGALLAATVAYAGANVGQGATIWTTIGPAALAAAGLILAWFVHELVGRASEAVTVDRDVASGVRLGGLLVAAGLLLGRAAAGDWTTAPAAASDLARGGVPAVALAAVAGVAHRWLRPSPRAPRRPVGTFGLGVAALYLAMAAGLAFLLPPGGR